MSHDQLELQIGRSAHEVARESFRRDGVSFQRAIRNTKAATIPRIPLKNLDGCRTAAITGGVARRIIMQYEWLGTVGRAAATYGLISPSEEILGVACFGWPASPESRDICGRDLRERAVCLERGACVHWAPKNAASFLIRRAVRLAHRDFGWEIFYAYADEDAGEIGTVYQASNWSYIGRGVGRTPGRSREDFRRPDGSVVSCRSLRHQGITKRQALASGWELIERTPKHKYVWFEGHRKKTLRGLCRYPFLPYPKRIESASKVSMALVGGDPE